MCKTYGKLPDDEWFDNLDPVLKMYMYESWCKDIEEKNEFARSYTILQGSFTNPEMARKMIDKKEGTNTFESTDEDYEKSIEMVKQDNKPKRRRRRAIKG